MRIVEHGQEYEVDLTADPISVQAIKHRKALPHGYSWGSDGTYLSTLKVNGANWKRIVKKAQAENEPVACPVCKNGRMTIEVNSSGTMSTMEIGCVHCDGHGNMTPAQKIAYDGMKAMWCSCGNPSNNTSFHDDAPGVKHHWTCDDCNKIVQVG